MSQTTGSDAAAAGLAALEEGDFEEAITQLRAAVALDPAAGALRRALGEALAATGDVAGAGAVLDEAAGLAPEDAEILLDLAHVRQLGGDGAAARAAIERAAALQPEDIGIRLAQARIYEAYVHRLGGCEEWTDERSWEKSSRQQQPVRACLAGLPAWRPRRRN